MTVWSFLMLERNLWISEIHFFSSWVHLFPTMPRENGHTSAPPWENFVGVDFWVLASPRVVVGCVLLGARRSVEWYQRRLYTFHRGWFAPEPRWCYYCFYLRLLFINWARDYNCTNRRSRRTQFHVNLTWFSSIRFNLCTSQIWHFPRRSVRNFGHLGL